MIRLIKPAAHLKEQALEYRQEHFDCGESTINGSQLLDKIQSYDEWLERVSQLSDHLTLKEGDVLTETYFAVNERNQIVGIIDLRRSLNEFFKDFGNCGFSVRPSQRCKGYASQMLGLICQKAREYKMPQLQLSAERDNFPSVKAIKKNGGIYERSFIFNSKICDIYIIKLSA